MNKKIKILSIVGARPQIIKAATLSNKIQCSFADKITEILVHTGQHYDSNMSDIFFREMEIPKPKYNLNLGGGSHSEMTGRMIINLEKICVKEVPDWVVVYGDTNSTLAAAIVASKLKIKIAHIEAGLRSNKMGMPEEINRILTDRVSTLLFCPTQNAVKNLVAEGFSSFSNMNILNVGDIMYECALRFSKKAKQPNLSFDTKKDNYILTTLHRAEITSNKYKLLAVILALNKINDSTKVVAPFHPRTIAAIYKLQLPINFEIISPVSYLEMLWLIQNSKLVITDSGGLQKEAFFFKKITLIPREETEWVELLQSGNSRLVGYDTNKIISEYNNFIKFKPESNFFGNGETSKLILNSIISYNKK